MKPSAELPEPSGEEALEVVAAHATQRAISAERAESRIRRRRLLEYLAQQRPETLTGQITQVVERGFAAELDRDPVERGAYVAVGLRFEQALAQIRVEVVAHDDRRTLRIGGTRVGEVGVEVALAKEELVDFEVHVLFVDRHRADRDVGNDAHTLLGAVPAVIDQATFWTLGKGLGDTIPLTDDRGRPFFFIGQWFPKIGVYEVPGQRYVPADAERGAWPRRGACRLAMSRAAAMPLPEMSAQNWTLLPSVMTPQPTGN